MMTRYQKYKSTGRSAVFYKSFRLQVKSAEDAGTFEGYASVFGVLDSYNEIVAPGSFTESLAATKAAGRQIPVVWQHDMAAPIGVYDSVVEDNVGLAVKGRLAIPDVRQAVEALALMKMGAVPDMSIGYYVDKYETNSETGIVTLTKLDLVEVSLVTLGANPAARISAVKARLDSGEFLTIREFEDLLREQGFSKAAAACIAERGYKSLAAEDSAKPTAANQSLIDSIKEFIK